MQEHKSFLIRDLLGDVLSERVHGKFAFFLNCALSFCKNFRRIAIVLVRDLKLSFSPLAMI